MNENPWYRLPATQPFVLPEDAIDVTNFNTRVGRNRFLHVDKILPEPFVGARDAPVVLLSNNPGFTEKGMPLRQDSVFLARMRNNLLHRPSEYPFVYLAPDLEGAGKKWWQGKLKHLLMRFGPEVVARSILNVPYLPYPSRRFGHQRLRVPSQEYSFRLVRDAVKRSAVIVFMRRKQMWLTAVQELNGYDRLYAVKNTQYPTVSPGNCCEYEKVVEAIEAAETKRRKAWEKSRASS